MIIDNRYEGRVYKCGRTFIEIVLVGCSIAVCEITDGSSAPEMAEIAVADCEINIMSGQWSPASFPALTALAASRLSKASA